jgi:hypothetical protein
MSTLTDRMKALFSSLRPRRRTSAARAIDRENQQRARQLRNQSGPPHPGTFTSGGPGGVF